MSAKSAPARRLDVLALLGGIGTLLVAAYLLGDGANWAMPSFDLRWLLAGAAGLAGIALLTSSMRRRD